jgi:hypothetical protein
MTVVTINQPKTTARTRSLEARRKDARKVVAQATAEAAQRGEEVNVVLVPSARAIPTVKAFATSIELGTIAAGWHGVEVARPRNGKPWYAIVLDRDFNSYAPLKPGVRAADVLRPLIGSFGFLPIDQLNADNCSAAYNAVEAVLGDSSPVQMVAAQLMGTLISEAIHRNWIAYDPFDGPEYDAGRR